MKQEDLIKYIETPELSVIPLGGQSELGQVLWVIAYQGKMIVVDAGAAYPTRELPGVDLLLPNTTFLEANQDQIEALLITSGNEEYIGAVPHVLKHVAIPKIMAPKFVNCLLDQMKLDLPDQHPLNTIKVENINLRQIYQLGPFEVEWIKVNDAVTQACALRITAGQKQIVYMTSYKLDQTPVDEELTDISRLAELGEQGVALLIGSSAGVERIGYSESESALSLRLYDRIAQAKGRVIVLMSGTNTYRLQSLLDIAKRCKRKILLQGDSLVHCAVASTLTGNLIYQQNLEINYSSETSFNIWYCPNCVYKRPNPDLFVDQIELMSSVSKFVLHINSTSIAVDLPLPGIFNIYNAAAASAAAYCVGINSEIIKQGLEKYETLFGRSEKLSIDGRNVIIQLIKNPAGASKSLESLVNSDCSKVLIAINDNYADGRDVSWLWDANFEILTQLKVDYIVSGNRAQDMAVRLKYASVKAEKISCISSLSSALNKAVKESQPNETLWILPTYTALLELQNITKIYKNNEMRN